MTDEDNIVDISTMRVNMPQPDENPSCSITQHVWAKPRLAKWWPQRYANWVPKKGAQCMCGRVRMP